MSTDINIESSPVRAVTRDSGGAQALPSTAPQSASSKRRGYARGWTLESLSTWALSRRWLPMVIAVLPVASLRYLTQNCIQWAGSLAYYTLLGLVPLLAVGFSALTVAGLHRELTPFVMNTIGAGSPEIAAEIVAFIDQTNVRAVAVFSLLGASLALLAILFNAELCFNMIWGGIPGRTVHRKMRSFAKVALVAPLMILLAFAFTAFLRPGSRLYDILDRWYLGDAALLLLQLVPFALLWGSFTLLYTGLPNTRVRRGSAIVGAVVAGILWLMAQWAYVTFLIGMVRYSAVYGTLWQIPILLAWIYIAWSIILFGAQVSRAHQEVVQIRRVMARTREA